MKIKTADIHKEIHILLKEALEIYLKKFMKKFQEQSMYKEFQKASLEEFLNKFLSYSCGIPGDILLGISGDISGRFLKKSLE